jgi:hypothetical protein
LKLWASELNSFVSFAEDVKEMQLIWWLGERMKGAILMQTAD